MKRWFFLAYGLAAYVGFLAVYAYFAGFVGNLLVPRSIDSPVVSGTAEAVLVNLSLVALFAAQHSIMARPAFKRLWTRLVPHAIERSTYVWVANLVLVILMWQWQPIDAIVWNVEQPVARGAMWALFGAGWMSVPLVSMMINHYDLFGLRQVWLHHRNQPYTPLPFRTPAAYSRVRHPLYLGWTLALFATPTMSVGHLLLAGTLTVYMALAAVVEERDLVAHFGHAYHHYRQHVPMFVPRLRSFTPAVESELEVNLAVEPER